MYSTESLSAEMFYHRWAVLERLPVPCDGDGPCVGRAREAGLPRAARAQPTLGVHGGQQRNAVAVDKGFAAGGEGGGAGSV
jgi:hypothetical protein